jgi:hypothetical protein
MLLRMTALDLVRRTSRRVAAAAIAFGIAAALAVVAATPSDAHPVPPKPLKVITVRGPPHHRAYVLKVWAKVHTPFCLSHAHGKPIRHFLAWHACTGLTRYLVTTTVNGRRVGFAQSTVGFKGNTVQQSYKISGEFRQLITKDATGNFNSLFASGYHTPAGPQRVPSPDAFKALSQDVVVTSVDAWYLRGTTPRNAAPLTQMANDIYLGWYY